jgi:hypothetical protein
MLAHAGSPKALDVHRFSFDSVDRCFAALAATAFVGLVAIVVWVWLSAPQGQHLHKTAIAQSASVDVTPLRLARLEPLICSAPAVITRHRCHQRRGPTVQNG